MKSLFRTSIQPIGDASNRDVAGHEACRHKRAERNTLGLLAEDSQTGHDSIMSAKGIRGNPFDHVRMDK